MLSIFSCVGWPSGCLLWKSVYSCLLPISSLDYLCFWVLSLIKFFIDFGYYLICHLQISSPSRRLPFSFTDCFIFCAEAFYLNEVQIVHFCFCFPCLWKHVKKFLQPESKKLLPVFSSRILMASCLTFRSFIHFEFIFVYGVRNCSKFILLHVAVQFSQHYLLKRLSFFHWIFFPALSKISWPYVCGSISGFSILFHCVCSCASTIPS
uniref:Uncharacterized protein n=1 Tax=Felis catus TaxID=9685 RepID=A0ABI7W7M1_FELCA